jgi:hypothetical protein
MFADFAQLSPKQPGENARKWHPSRLAQPLHEPQYPPLSSLFGRLSAPLYHHPRLRNFEPARPRLPAKRPGLRTHPEPGVATIRASCFERLPLNSFPLASSHSPAA